MAGDAAGAIRPAERVLPDMTNALRYCIGLLVLFALGCEQDLGEVRDPVGDNPPLADWNDAAPPNEAPADDASPTITIDGTEELEDGTVRLFGTSGDDRGVASIQIDVGASGPYPVIAMGRGFAEWEATVDAPPSGPVMLRATAFDAMGNTATAEALLDRPMPADDTPPSIVITAPLDRLETNVAQLFVDGTAEDDTAIAEVTVSLLVGDAPAVNAIELGRARTGDFFRSWSLGVPVPPAADVTYIVRATDIAGNTAEARTTIVSRAAPPHEAPRLVRSMPADGAVLDILRPTFTLTIEADAPLTRVGAGPVGGPLLPATPVGDGGDTFEVPLWLVPGENPLRVISLDADGLVGRDELTVTQDDGWGDLVPVDLVAPGEPGGRVQLELDKAGVIEMFPEDVQRETVLMNLDATPLVENALGVIRASCGAGWEGPHFVNDAFLFDCPAEWGQPELNLWGLLTMTPSNVDVSGTDLGFLPDLTPGNVGLEFGEVLGTALGLELREPMLDAAPLTEAIIEALIAPHPNTTAAGEMPVTLEDGLLDMVTLADKFGPAGGHPGFIAGRVEAAVLTDDFRMNLTMNSNLTLYEGADLSIPDAPDDRSTPAKRYFADRDPRLPVVDLAFLDIEDFDLLGIAEAPVVAMDFSMVESELEATPGDRMQAVPPPLGSPQPDFIGNSDVWGPPFETWMLEHVVALASLKAFGDLEAGCDGCAGIDDGAMLWLANPEADPCPVDAQGDFDERTCQRYDFAEITIGRTGYDCQPGTPCTNFQTGPTDPGLTEHFDRLVADECVDDNAICRELFGPNFTCHDHGVCHDRTDPNECFNDDDCEGATPYCAGGLCSATEPACTSDTQCPRGSLCYYNECVDVPPGWFRVWLPEIRPIYPGYMWDVVLSVAQARMRDGLEEGERADVVFQLEGVSVGLTADEIEGLVRESLQAQRLQLAQSLLGSYTESNPEIDIFVDSIDGESWLVGSPCRFATAFPLDPAGPAPPPDVPDTRCNAPDAGFFDLGRAPLPGQVGQPMGAPRVRLADLAPGQAVIYRGAAGAPERRFEVRDVRLGGPEQDRLSLWLRR